MSQVRTFQVRLPKGDHDAVLDAWGMLSGHVCRDIHAWLRAALQEAEALPEAERRSYLRNSENFIKKVTIETHGISGRQYNGLFAQLMGLWESRRELSKLDVERLKGRIQKKSARLTKLRKKLAKDRSAREAIAKKVAIARAKGKPDPQPTKAQAEALLAPEHRRKIRFEIHHGERKLASLNDDLEKASAAANPNSIPSIVFGGSELLRDRHKIHPNDRQSLARWRKRWDERRSAGFMLIGGSDELTGNKSCKMTADGTGSVRLDLRLPDGLGLGKHLGIGSIKLPDFGRREIEKAIAKNAARDNRIALTYRFVRDPDYRSDRMSAWRVCITIKTEVDEVGFGPRVVGIDANADHLALALIDATGNPVETHRIPLRLRGKSTGQREAIIGDAAAEAVEWARIRNASIALEALNFAKKKRELADAKKRCVVHQKRYARMLSSFAYRKIGEGILRRAQRLGVAVRRVNPAYTSLIGEVNYSRRYGMTRHQGAAVAIARRASGHSERINYIHGYRGCRNALPAPEEARRHVWRQWAMVHRERTASAASARRNKPAHPTGRGPHPGPSGQEETCSVRRS